MIIRYVLAFTLVGIGVEVVAGEAQPLNVPHLENAHKLTEKVITGAEPHDEAAFIELQKLGIKTVISVDGATPKADLARKYGMRYVHLPIGYDGVPAERSREIARAFEELPGPIYMHCHHGKHRGPAAAVVGCVVSGKLTNDEAIAAMKRLGTGAEYLGLWDAAKKAQTMPVTQLQAINVEFKEKATVPPLAEAMVLVDETTEHLEACRVAKWTTPPDHKDLQPAHEALKLKELYTELARTDDSRARPEEYRKLLNEGREIAEKLETALRKLERKETPDPAPDALFTALKQNCKSCHKVYRNTKKAD